MSVMPRWQRCRASSKLTSAGGQACRGGSNGLTERHAFANASLSFLLQMLMQRQPALRLADSASSRSKAYLLVAYNVARCLRQAVKISIPGSIPLQHHDRVAVQPHPELCQLLADLQHAILSMVAVRVTSRLY